jgi:hypothetical protein
MLGFSIRLFLSSDKKMSESEPLESFIIIIFRTELYEYASFFSCIYSVLGFFNFSVALLIPVVHSGTFPYLIPNRTTDNGVYLQQLIKYHCFSSNTN